MGEAIEKITYEILVATSIVALEGQVNVSLDAGYILQGGICVVHRPDDVDKPYIFYQAVVGNSFRKY